MNGSYEAALWDDVRKSWIDKPLTEYIENAFSAVNSAPIIRKPSIKHLLTQRRSQPKHLDHVL
jgi:hypothetical protein